AAEADEDPAAIALVPDLIKAHLALREAGTVGTGVRHADQRPVRAIGPVVIEAGEVPGVAAALAAHHAAAMAAGIMEEGEPITGPAHHRGGPAAAPPSQEIARLRQLALMPGIEPATVEDALLLVAEEIGIAIDLRAEAEDARFLVLDKKGI